MRKAFPVFASVDLELAEDNLLTAIFLIDESAKGQKFGLRSGVETNDELGWRHLGTWIAPRPRLS